MYDADASVIIDVNETQETQSHHITQTEDNITTESTAIAVASQTQTSTVRRDAKGRLLPGSVVNPGGRPKKLREIEKMLNTEHRNLPAMRETFARLRALALGEVILVPAFTAEGIVEVKAELKADSRFMQLYLDRLLGPAKAFDDNMDLSDAPVEVLEYLRIKVSR